MIVLGLTGSIAMGKSTIGAMLETLRVPVHEADRAVHKYLQRDSEARAEIASVFPIYEFPDIYEKKTYEIKRSALGKLVFEFDDLREKLEAIIHPLVQKDQQEFIRKNATLGHDIVCLDIPLLFETGAEKRVNYTLVVSAPYLVQRQRVLERTHMNEEKFEGILARQMADSEKCSKADYIIKTGIGKAHSMKMLKEALLDIRIKSGLIPDPELEEDAEENY